MHDAWNVGLATHAPPLVSVAFRQVAQASETVGAPLELAAAPLGNVVHPKPDEFDEPPPELAALDVEDEPLELELEGAGAQNALSAHAVVHGPPSQAQALKWAYWVLLMKAVRQQLAHAAREGWKAHDSALPWQRHASHGVESMHPALIAR
jgi:hypothetical protein